MRITESMLAVVVLTSGLSTGCAWIDAAYEPLEVADRVDVGRYMGLWYEIARYPVGFEEGCIGVTAEYSLRADGRVSVLNTCGGVDGAPARTIEGFAEIADPTTNAKLTVYFFYPFGGPYWIIDLDQEYQWAVVGDPTRSTLWILSRAPEMDAGVLADIFDRLPEKGYDPERLEFTPQPGATAP